MAENEDVTGSEKPGAESALAGMPPTVLPLAGALRSIRAIAEVLSDEGKHGQASVLFVALAELQDYLGTSGHG